MVRMTLSRMKPRHENHRILQTHQRAATTGHAGAWGEPVRLLFQAVTSGVQAGLYYGDNTCLQRLAALNP